MNRRGFLRLAAMAGAGLLLPAPLGRSMIIVPPPSPFYAAQWITDPTLHYAWVEDANLAEFISNGYLPVLPAKPRSV